MIVESVSASYLPQQTTNQTLSRERNSTVRDVFSEVLEAVGRRGFASAQEVKDDPSPSERIQATWSDWFDAEQIDGRYTTAKSPERLKQGFGELLARANAEGGYTNPKSFLKGLKEDELRTVQNVNWLAEPIDVDGLTEEGALNLILPPPAQVDLNRDGLTQTGAAYGIKFPDSNTPAQVVAAWEEATAGLAPGEKMTYELQMKLPLLTANIVLDRNGAFARRLEPGDSGFKNPMADAGYSYVQATQGQLDNLEFAKNQISKEQYARQTAFWNQLQELLEEKGSP